MNRLVFVALILFSMTSLLLFSIFNSNRIREDFDSLINTQILKTDILREPGTYEALQDLKDKGWLFYQVQNKEQLNDTFLFVDNTSFNTDKYYIFIVPTISNSEVWFIDNIPERSNVEGISILNTRSGKSIIIPLIWK